MIDLRNRSLPNTICVNGGLYSIHTDFREWLKFGEIIKNENLIGKDVLFLFKNDFPTSNPFDSLLEFYINANATPKKEDSNDNTKIFDYVLDGEYILGSFMAVYGIDLTEIEYLHWHKFQALFRALPDDSCIRQIMSRRAWKKSSKSMETQLQEAKQIWSFPIERTVTDEELQNELMEEFYGTI